MRAEKKYLIDEVETHLKKSDYVILANFNGVTVADAAELRGKLAASTDMLKIAMKDEQRVTGLLERGATSQTDLDQSIDRGPEIRGKPNLHNTTLKWQGLVQRRSQNRNCGQTVERNLGRPSEHDLPGDDN